MSTFYQLFQRSGCGYWCWIKYIGLVWIKGFRARIWKFHNNTSIALVWMSSSYNEFKFLNSNSLIYFVWIWNFHSDPPFKPKSNITYFRCQNALQNFNIKINSLLLTPVAKVERFFNFSHLKDETHSQTKNKTYNSHQEKPLMLQTTLMMRA